MLGGFLKKLYRAVRPILASHIEEHASTKPCALNAALEISRSGNFGFGLAATARQLQPRKAHGLVTKSER